jgi:hypothetical protein
LGVRINKGDKMAKKKDVYFEAIKKGLNAIDATDKQNRKKFAKLDQKARK